MSNNDKRKRISEYVEKLKAESVCIRCKSGEQLTFHHRNPAQKSFDISDARRNRISIPSLQKELNKCDILCDRCHKLEHEHLFDLPFPYDISRFVGTTRGSSGSPVKVKLKHIETNIIFVGEHEYSRRIAHDIAVDKLTTWFERN